MKYDLLKSPHEIEIDGRVFAVSKIPALKAVEIYDSISSMVVEHGAIGITKLPPKTIRDLLQFVCWRDGDGSWQGFETDIRIDSVFANFFDLQKVVLEMVKENFSFLIDGSLLALLGEVVGQARDFGL